MNFNELYKKIANLDNPMNECGEMHGAIGAPMPSPQPDSVTMSVNLNGSGSNGIRDLMNILKNIDDVPGKQDAVSVVQQEPDHDEMVLIGTDHQDEEPDDMPDEEPMIVHDDEPFDEFIAMPEYTDETDELIDDSYENSISGAAGIPKIFKMAAVTATGDDLASKGKGALKANGGENPFNVNESLVSNLHRLYHDIKSR
jgi:hypothetical protein